MVAGIQLVDKAKANKYGSALYKYSTALEPIVKTTQLPLMAQPKPVGKGYDLLRNPSRSRAQVPENGRLEHKSK